MSPHHPHLAEPKTTQSMQVGNLSPITVIIHNVEHQDIIVLDIPVYDVDIVQKPDTESDIKRYLLSFME